MLPVRATFESAHDRTTTEPSIPTIYEQVYGNLVDETTRHPVQSTPQPSQCRANTFPMTTAKALRDPNDTGPDIAPRSTSLLPQLNSAPVFGLRPNSPAQFLLAATGERPMRFCILQNDSNNRQQSSSPLPAGLHLDPINGVITGRTQQRGTFHVTVMATNRHGISTRSLTIHVGDNDSIALTPPRGINTWNSCGDKVTAQKVQAIANAAVRLQLRDYGYTYINIDDGWQGQRDQETGMMQPNDKFANLPQLFADLHAMGFHCGIYGTPWKWSYAFYPGSSIDTRPWRHRRPSMYIPNMFGWRTGNVRYEEQDAAYFASIGADFVKWDWYQNDITSTRIMAEALRRHPRDIVYSLSNSAPLKNAKHYKELSNMVRTTADIRDAWDRNSPRDAFCLSIKEIWREHDQWAAHCGPGHWTDPDMLVVGPVGWGCRTNACGEHVPCNHLTLDEQLTHMTLWILWSAPLLVGCDLEWIDDKTLDMLCNRGALSINEDSLGQQGQTVSRHGDAVVVSKPLANGDLAVGLFNTGNGNRKVSITWNQLELGCKDLHSVHDVWADKDLGDVTEGLSWDVREHSAKLFRVSASKSQ